MKGKFLSEELIALSQMMMLSKSRGEMIDLAGRLNDIIGEAVRMEEAEQTYGKKYKDSALSATIKFTKKEIESMSKTFKKEFIANGLCAHVIKRPSGKNGNYYEIRYRRNGYNISVSNKDLAKAKKMFVERTKTLENDDMSVKRRLTFGAILNEWLNYKRGKVVERTWSTYKARAEKYLDKDFCEKEITKIRTVDVDQLLSHFSARLYEDMRTIVNSVFNYAIASGILSNNPVALVPFKRAERKPREALSELEIHRFIKTLKKDEYANIRQCALAMLFFGLRPCELDSEARFENGFLVARNRKRKGGKIEYKKIPVPKEAQGLIDFEKTLEMPCHYSKFAEKMKKILGGSRTSYNLRHTFASKCSEKAKAEVVDVWMGDSSERLVGRVYVHFSDDFMKGEMDKVKFL